MTEAMTEAEKEAYAVFEQEVAEREARWAAEEAENDKAKHELAVAVMDILDHYREHFGQDYIWSTVAKWSDETLWGILWCGESEKDPYGRINQARAEMLRRWEEERKPKERSI